MPEDIENNLNLGWFCLRSQLKHEHIAAAHLRRQCQIDVFVPFIRFRRAARSGPVWVTQALFPGYLFAKFDWTNSLKRVYYSPGVCGIVHFGCHWPMVPEQAIKELRFAFGPDEIRTIPAEMSPGDRVQIAGGCFHGLQAVVAQVMPSKKRVAVLLNFLGNQTRVEIDLGSLIKETEGPSREL